MNQHFVNGFLKAANAAGIPEDQIANMLGQHEGAAPEASEAPAPEAAPAGGSEIDELLSKLSPEELEQLANELAGDIQGGGGEEGNVAELANAISQHLGEHPEVAELAGPAAGADEAALAKQSAVNFIKSAEYVEGFLQQALGRGLDIKQAVDMYDAAFSATLSEIKTSELKGNQTKLDVDHDGKIEASDLAALRAHKKHEDSETPAEEKKEHEDEKTAAYYEGVLERAREYGLSDAEAIQVVKEALDKSASAPTAAIQNGVRSFTGKAKDFVTSNLSKGLDVAKKHPKTVAAVGAGGIGAGYTAKSVIDDKD
jgi:hypothetical protein